MLALISTLLLVACATAPVVKCPGLPDPPPAIVDALEQAGRSNPSAAAWVIGLDRHYQKLDECKGV